jgi:hypothetical protein
VLLGAVQKPRGIATGGVLIGPSSLLAVQFVRDAEFRRNVSLD